MSLQRPRVDSAGQVTINLTSAEALPADLTDVTLNIDRAIEKKARASKFPEHFAYQLTANLQANTTAYSGMTAGITLYSGTNCYQLTLSQPAPQMTLPSGLSCGGIVFTNGLASLSIASQTKPASALFSSTMAPPGQSSFKFSSVISSWPLNG